MKRTLILVPILALALTIVPANAAVGDAGQVSGFTIQPIDWDGAVMGRYVLFDGYKANRIINNCDESTCLGFPIRASVITYNDDENVRMMYYYAEQYIERVKSSTSLIQHREGQLDAQCVFNRYYVDADGYCDSMAEKWCPGAKFLKSEDMSFYRQTIDTRLAEFYASVYPGMSQWGMSLDWVDITAAQRVYTYEMDGEQYAICVMAEVDAMQYTTSGYGFTTTDILWHVPAYYILWAPLDTYQQVHDDKFITFAENTSVNDEMNALNDQLNYKIRDEVCRQMNMMCAASSAYAQAMTALTFSMVESNMSYGSYSSSRFSDYIFDQNDYTLSDGSSIKVSTSYDYVWEGSGGTVYYGNSLLDAPGGATLLNPNR